MNIIKECYWELFVQHGPALFNLPSVLQAPTPIQQALQQCHQVQIRPGCVKAKVNGGRGLQSPRGYYENGGSHRSPASGKSDFV